MKIVVVILTTCLMQVSAAGLAQKLTLSKKGATLEQIFTEIRKQTGYYVVYSENKVDKNIRLDVNFKDTDLKDVLDVIGKSQDLVYSFDEKNISLKPREPSLLDRARAVIQSVAKGLLQDLRGRVVDENGKPLPNASIRVKGKSAVTNTNQNGEFEIKGVDEDAVLLVSYVGFKTLEIPVKGAVMPLEIKLNVATGELEEVKVVYNTGYQNVDKTRATGSFEYMSNELINRKIGTNILSRIDGVSGVLFDKRNPSSPKLQIRGLYTLTNTITQPLIVLDNFPYTGDINKINPNDC